MKAIKNDLQRQVDQKPGIWKIFFTTAGVAGFAVGIIVASIFAALQLMTDNFSNGLEAGRGVALEALEQYQEQLDQIAESQRQMAETIEEMRDDDTQESEEER
jgi:demethoxyubiquinone hydroxylase (CLK1/Coq7/Cat5 family)